MRNDAIFILGFEKGKNFAVKARWLGRIRATSLII